MPGKWLRGRLANFNTRHVTAACILAGAPVETQFWTVVSEIPKSFAICAYGTPRRLDGLHRLWFVACAIGGHREDADQLALSKLGFMIVRHYDTHRSTIDEYAAPGQ